MGVLIPLWGCEVAEPVLHVDIGVLVSSAELLVCHADELDAGLAAIASEWSELRATWSGDAASQYEPCWEDWHYNAQKLNAVLVETAKFLGIAANVYTHQESSSAQRPAQRGHAALVNATTSSDRSAPEMQKPSTRRRT